MRICSVEGCTKKHRRNGFCDRHSQMYKNHGRIIGNPERSSKELNEIEVRENGEARIVLYNLKSEPIGFAKIDSADVELIRGFKWRFSYQNYVVTGTGKTQITLGEVLLGVRTSIWEVIDHIDRDTTNYHRNNLRLASKSLNALNSKNRSDNVSGCKGVSYDRLRGKWVAHLKVDGVFILNKRFDTKEEAITARQKEIERIGLCVRSDFSSSTP